MTMVRLITEDENDNGEDNDNDDYNERCIVTYQSQASLAVLILNKKQVGGEVLSSVEYLSLAENDNWASLPPLPLPRLSKSGFIKNKI